MVNVNDGRYYMLTARNMKKVLLAILVECGTSRCCQKISNGSSACRNLSFLP